MAQKLVNQLTTSSISDANLGIVTDPNSGISGQTSYKAMKDYFQQGIPVGGLLTTASFNTFTSSINTQVTNVYASESNYTLTASFNPVSASFYSFSGSYVNDSASINSKIGKAINFIVGDGQTFTPSVGSSVFSSSLLVNKSVLQLSVEGVNVCPISRSVAWFSYSGSIGKINVNNLDFSNDTFFQIIYV